MNQREIWLRTFEPPSSEPRLPLCSPSSDRSGRQMSEHVQHKGDQDAEILLQVSGKQVEHKHALGIWLKTVHG
ncbi:Protein phosphatase 2A regulatory B subunit (B56 family) [Musa troglodytarum]|uniref:Protein phosphatase 2A regulatory B subunit (B56 family) n=1 Tax=Musa troglodytarum TaxID=320322 RepID=A0A9E7HI93_9LILI|nr:Protein phosphatase 2A regulatory B subunit (B56 family) [Musa troglodytarum]